MSESSRSVVVVSSHIALFERLVADAGFSVAGAADLPVNGERLVELFQPAFVIFDVDLPGEHDIAAIARLRQAAPRARIVLVVDQAWLDSASGTLGASAVLGRDDLLELGPLLLELEASPPPGLALERRSGRDRREVQDWSKIGWEYRKHARRAEDRRREAAPA